MKVTLPRKRAAQIMTEELEKYLKENPNADKKLLEQYINKHIGNKGVTK
jgi:hypothetical protein